MVAQAGSLREFPKVTGLILTPVEGHGTHTARDTQLSDRDRVAGFVPCLRTDLALEAAAVQSLLERLSARAVLAGRCVYWVTDVARFGRL